MVEITRSKVIKQVFNILNQLISIFVQNMFCTHVRSYKTRCHPYLFEPDPHGHLVSLHVALQVARMCSFNISSQILPGCSSVIDIRDDEGDCDNCNQSQSPSQSATAGALVPIDVEEIGEPIPAASVAPSSSKSSGPRPRPRFRLAFHKQKKNDDMVDDQTALRELLKMTPHALAPRSSFTSKKINSASRSKEWPDKGFAESVEGFEKETSGCAENC